MRERSLQEGDREDLRRDEEEEDEKSHFHQSGKEERRENVVQRRDNRHGGENYSSCHEDFIPRVSQSVLSLTEVCSSPAAQSRMAPKMCQTPGGSTSDKMTPKSCVDKLPAFPSPHSQLRSYTLPSVTVVPPLLHLPPLVNQPDSHLRVPMPVSPSKSRSMVFLPHPPSSSPPSSSSRASVRPALLPLLPLASSVTSLVAPPACCCSERRLLRRHSVQLEQIRGGREQMNYFDL